MSPSLNELLEGADMVCHIREDALIVILHMSSTQVKGPNQFSRLIVKCLVHSIIERNSLQSSWLKHKFIEV